MHLRDCYFSFVMDSVVDHSYKAELLLLTLRKFAGIAQDKIVVQCTDRVPDNICQHFRKQGYTITRVAPYLDGKYCNKLRQLDFFREIRWQYAGVFFLDIDLAILEPLELPNWNSVNGKVVDAPNPPISNLRKIFLAAGLRLPEIMQCDWGTGETLRTNLNGGFIFIPKDYISTLSVTWPVWAEFLYHRPYLFDRDGQRNHIDQISFAMALEESAVPLHQLNANWNFPCHCDVAPTSYQTKDRIRALHYHHCLNEQGQLQPIFRQTGTFSQAVKRVNAEISNSRELNLLNTYRNQKSKTITDTIRSEEAFSLQVS